MSDIKTECFYKQGENTVIFNEKQIKIGTKSISTANVYHINIDYITNYERLFKVATVVTSAVAIALLFALFTNGINILVALAGAFIVSMYSYVIKPKRVIKNNPESFIKMIDIFHGDKHDAIVVKAGFELDTSKYTKLSKTMTRKRVLRYYKSRMKDSRKYLANQIEINKAATIDVLYEKYSKVAEMKYRQESIFSKRTVEILRDAYYDTVGKDLTLAIKISTFTLILVIVLSVYIALSNDFSFHGIF